MTTRWPSDGDRFFHDTALATDVFFAGSPGKLACRPLTYHVAHVSTARTVALGREAKRRGLPVTCEVTAHHLPLTDEACAHYDTRTKVMPLLRTAADQEALLAGLGDGTIDCIATNHYAHRQHGA